jgi:hypothetical protein
MRSIGASIFLLAVLSSPLAVGQRPNAKMLSEAMETTVCKVLTTHQVTTTPL